MKNQVLSIGAQIRLFTSPLQNGLWYRDDLLTGVERIEKEDKKVLPVVCRAGDFTTLIRVDDLPEGLYLMQVQRGTERFHEKFIRINP
jgi:hypothetical protein